ncbi:MAG: Acetyltransferase domain [Patescibacteria group bacterium]|nr:GNAT family N-acetyltransferase [Candidatus Saccharibacteria bacterium]MDQ5963026.1 Acetyltransferase domain [Patescibacteria group bacterium]
MSIELSAEKGDVSFRCVEFAPYQKTIEELRYAALFRPVAAPFLGNEIKDLYATTVHVGGFVLDTLIATARITQCSDSKLAFIERVGVDPAYARGGERRMAHVGARLIKYAEAETRQMACRPEQIQLLSRESAVPFYESMGYVKNGKTDKTIYGRSVPVMFKDLR